MAEQDQVLVAVMNKPLDFNVARDQHWYRIPANQVHKRLKRRWPPQWLAFYQTDAFGNEGRAINYYCRVLGEREVYRWELFPEEPRDEKGHRRYYKIFLGPLQHLSRPIISRRWWRIVFIQTTLLKFSIASEINDLYDDSPLEDRLWAELKQRQIPAERQEFITIKGREYSLDFVIHCVGGNLNIETDGDTWHADPKRIPYDNLRDNALETIGFKLLRFNTHQINEELAQYCIPTIIETINRLDGPQEDRMIPRPISSDPSRPTQLSLFDDLFKGT